MIKTELLKCRCTPEEKIFIKDYAKSNGISLSQTIRKAIKTFKEIEKDEFK